MSRVDEILAVYINKGSNAYGGERINQLEHALQPRCSLSKQVPTLR